MQYPSSPTVQGQYPIDIPSRPGGQRQYSMGIPAAYCTRTVAYGYPSIPAVQGQYPSAIPAALLYKAIPAAP